MVLFNKIPAEKFRALGFCTKMEAIKALKTSGISGRQFPSEAAFFSYMKKNYTPATFNPVDVPRAKSKPKSKPKAKPKAKPKPTPKPKPKAKPKPTPKPKPKAKPKPTPKPKPKTKPKPTPKPTPKPKPKPKPKAKPKPKPKANPEPTPKPKPKKKITPGDTWGLTKNIKDMREMLFSEKRIPKTLDKTIEANFMKLLMAGLRVDFFETPEKYAWQIYDHFNSFVGPREVKVLEPTMGLGGLLTPFIKHNTDFGKKQYKIDGIEINKDFCVELDVPEVKKHINVICGDFLKYPTKNKYNLIILNPPFQAPIEINGVFKNKNKAYFFFLFKALEHIDGYLESIYFIAPTTHFMSSRTGMSADMKIDEQVYLKIPISLAKEAQGLFPDIFESGTIEFEFKKNQEFEYLSKKWWNNVSEVSFHGVSITYLGVVKGFKAMVKRGRVPRTLGMQAGLYHITL